MSSKPEMHNDTTPEEELENQPEEQLETDGIDNEQDITNEEDEVDELTRLRNENAALNDKFLRLYSEFENFRRRTAKEKIDLISNAGGKTIEKFLPVLDDLDRASQNNNQATDIEAVKAGFELIEHKMRHVLETMGVKTMDAMGKDFDVDLHEAITKIPAPEPELKGKVVDVIEAGYFLNDKVLRYAKVVVGE
jgi:molecular chaperone GrpE